MINNIRFRQEGTMLVLQVQPYATSTYVNASQLNNWRDATVQDMLDLHKFFNPEDMSCRIDMLQSRLNNIEEYIGDISNER